MKAERILDLVMTLGEGPMYDEQTDTLHWVDIVEGRLWQHDLGSRQSRHTTMGESVGLVVPHRKGGLVAALKDSLVHLKEAHNTLLAGDVDAEHPGNRFNDGKCDARGRLLCGTMDGQGEQGRGSLYVLEEGQPLRKLVGGVSVSNGIGFSLDNRYMYYVDTPTGFLWRFEYDLDTGEVANRTPLIDYRGERGDFDGLCVDNEGCIWAAHWGGYQVSRWDPETGQKIGQVDVPAPFVTSCCFGGPELDRLFITTAAGWDAALKQEYPLSGSLFAVAPGVRGLPVQRFGRD